MGHNRGSWLMEHDSWLGRQYVVRKAFSMFRRIGDLINHARLPRTLGVANQRVYGNVEMMM